MPWEIHVSRSRLLQAILIGLAVGLVALILRHDEGTIAGMRLESFASLLSLGALAVVIGSGVLRMARGRGRETLTSIAFWLVIALFLALAYMLFKT